MNSRPPSELPSDAPHNRNMKTIKISGKKTKAVDLREVAIDKIKAHVERMCRSAMDDMCVQPAGMEELEVMLRKLAK